SVAFGAGKVRELDFGAVIVFDVFPGPELNEVGEDIAEFFGRFSGLNTNDFSFPVLHHVFVSKFLLTSELMTSAGNRIDEGPYLAGVVFHRSSGSSPYIFRLVRCFGKGAAPLPALALTRVDFVNDDVVIEPAIDKLILVPGEGFITHDMEIMVEVFATFLVILQFFI